MSDQNSEGKWAYGRAGGPFYGGFDTREEAILEARDIYEGSFYVGQLRPPIRPEGIINAADILESLANDDDYQGEWAEGWPDASEAQVQELDDEFTRVLAAWLDRHGLRPKWFVVPDPELIEAAEAQAVEGGLE